MNRIAGREKLLIWARKRARMEVEELVSRFPRLPDWETGKTAPTLKQLEAFAKAVHAPVGYLFLSEPPEESVPIPDFRTFAGQSMMRPSPNLLDTIYTCQERQIWYREFVRVAREQERAFVGSAMVEMSAETVAAQMRETLGFELEARGECSTWSEALRLFIQQTEEAGILVMVSGVVASNNQRKLDPTEFRGFALSDSLAPLVFINGADSKAGQMFTLAHELAHLWLGASALSNTEAAPRPNSRREEVWCNAVAAELLAPLSALQGQLRTDETIEAATSRLARYFKVSTLVILRRLLDAGWLTRTVFDRVWSEECERLRTISTTTTSGGNFYHTTATRASRRLTRALVVSTLEGQTLYRDAFRMLGISKTNTLHKLGQAVGVIS